MPKYTDIKKVLVLGSGPIDAARRYKDEAERDALRREYIDAVLGSLQGQLDHTYIVDEQGNKRKLKKKGE